MEFLKNIGFVLSIAIIILFTVAINIIIRFALNDGQSLTTALPHTIYFFLFLILLLSTLRLKMQKIYTYLMYIFIITIFPCIYIGGYRGYTIGITSITWSLNELLPTSFSSTFPNQYKNLAFFRGIETKNTLTIFQLYSILFAIAQSFIWIKVKPLYKDFVWFYDKYKVPVLICIILTSLYVLKFSNENTIIVYWGNTWLWYKSLIYIFLYSILLFSYIVNIKNFKARNTEILAIIFILLFPTISVTSNTFDFITADTVPWYERAIDIYPLIFTLPNSIKYLIIDIINENRYALYTKLYSLFQIFLVLFTFPTLLTSKNNQNG